MKCLECANFDVGGRSFAFCRGTTPPDVEIDCPAFRAGKPRSTKPPQKYQKSEEKSATR